MTACRFALNPSPRLAAILAGLHGAAAAAAASLSGIPLALVAIGLAISAVWTVADALAQLPSSVRGIELEEDGSGAWHDRSGRRHAVLSTRASWVSAHLVILGLRTARWRTRWVVLMPDSATAEALRQLRVWLKWRPS